MNHKKAGILVLISVIAATLLAAGTVVVSIGSAVSDHSAFAYEKRLLRRTQGRRFNQRNLPTKHYPSKGNMFDCWRKLSDPNGMY
jgi:hypothetical protein